MMLQRMTGFRSRAVCAFWAMWSSRRSSIERESLGSYNSLTAYNKLIDAIPPESDTAQEFHDLVERILAKQASPEDIQQAQHWLETWRDNDAKLQPILSRSPMTMELAPVSSTFARLPRLDCNRSTTCRRIRSRPQTGPLSK